MKVDNDGLVVRINQLINKFGLKNSEFANKIGIAPQNLYSMLNGKRAIGEGIINKILLSFDTVNKDWLLTGDGAFFITDDVQKEVTHIETRPRIPLNAAAGSVTIALSGVKQEDAEELPFVHAFSNYNYTILVKGDSMEPEFHSGDELACLQLRAGTFIQWGHYHVLDTEQGVVVKRIYEDGDFILCKSDNNELYKDFKILKNEIFNIGKVIGMLRRY